MAKLHTLENGMQILLEENHAAPVISFHLLVKVGSAFETDKEAGICHVIEHMLFKGTPSRPVGAIASEVEAAGGEINAYTSFDQTVFYINMASRFSQRGLSILADAIQNPIFDELELEREKEVILEEVRREKDNPFHRSSELLFTKSYKHHPYKNPIIGFAETVKSFTRESLFDFYRRWYTPQNIALIVVGEFSTGTMIEMIEKSFTGFKGKNPPVQKITAEPAPKNMLIFTETNPVSAAYFSLGFHIPEITHSDIPALDILSHVLAGSDSSRLEQVVKEQKQLVNEIHSYAFTPKDPGILIIGGLTSPEKINGAMIAIWDEIGRLHSSPVSISELNRAKLNIKSSEIYEKETTSGQAGKYAYFMATTGDYLFEKQYYRALQDVGADDLRRAAQQYLVPEKMTMIVVHPPEGTKDIKTGEIREHLRKKRPTPKLIAKAKRHVSPPFMHRFSNGLQLILRENHTLPIVSCCFAMLGGLRFENRNNNGINNLIAQTIIKGTENKSAIEIAKRIESVAGSIGGFSGRNTLGVKAEFLSDKFDEGFGLFAEVLTKPSFEASEVAKEKEQVLDAIKHEEDSLTTLAFNKFLSALFPRHPYGLRLLGSQGSVNRLNHRQLADYYRNSTLSNKLTISVVGDISPDEVIEFAEKRLAFSEGKKIRPSPPKPESPAKKPVIIEYMRPGKEQSHIVMGFLGPVIASADRYALGVLNNILSGQGGRLFLNLRDRMSLAYSVNSTFFAGLEPGFIAIYIGTEPAKVGTALSGIKRELETLVEKGVTAKELSRSKNYIIGSFELERQRNMALANSYTFNQLYGLGINEVDIYPKKINAVTIEDISKAAKKYLRLDAPVTAIIRPE